MNPKGSTGETTGGTAGRTGRQAEDYCALHLQRAGLRVLARNWRCRLGEIDLIAQEGETLVFVEVRFRRGQRYGGARESIGARKRTRLLAAARAYLSGRREVCCRFDAMLLDSLDPPALEWIRDAIQDAPGQGR